MYNGNISSSIPNSMPVLRNTSVLRSTNISAALHCAVLK